VWPAGPLGQYCRAAVKPIADQGQVWSFLDVPAILPQRPPVEAVGGQGGEEVPVQVEWSPSPPAPRGEAGSRVPAEEPGTRDVDLEERASTGGCADSLPLGQGGGLWCLWSRPWGRKGW
jgi:hypothetical protein